MQNKQRESGQYRRKLSGEISLLSVCTIILLLLGFLVVTLSNTYRLSNSIRVTTEHPVVVSRTTGQIQTRMMQMRLHIKQLQLSHGAADRASTETTVLALENQISSRLEQVRSLFLGPADDVIQLQKIYGEIVTRQAHLFRTLQDDSSAANIADYEREQLLPLYERFSQACEPILSFAENYQLSTYSQAHALWNSTLVWSIVIVGTTASCLLLFHFLLRKLNKEIYYKNQQFDLLSETIDEAFLIFEQQNPACEFVAGNVQEVLGLSKAALTQERSKLYQYLDTESIEDIKAKLYETPVPLPWNITIRYHHPHKSEIRLLSACFYQAGGVGHHNRYLLTLADVTEEQQGRVTLQDALANAQNANSAKRDFLSRMSHEIRTPMNAIIGMTTIAAASITDSVRVEDCLSKISYSSKHLLLLINDILDMSRIESNKMTISSEPFDLCQFVNNFAAVVYPQAKSKGVSFTAKIRDFGTHTTYIGDPLRLNQILLNLTSNAIKFTEPGGDVALEVTNRSGRGQKERIRFTVSDTGIGMSQEALTRIFLPFEQAAPTIAQKYGGTGLGMSITHNLVTLMTGTIDVKSEPGGGTLCVVELPFTKGESRGEPLTQATLDGIKTLVVDDDKDVCEHTTLLLTRMNIHADWVLSGAEAVARVVEARRLGDDFDLCLIDCRMPGMDGIETTRRMREHVGPETTIIIISAYDWSEIEQDARAAGATAFISKPLFLSSLYNVLVNVTHGAYGRSASPNPKPAMSQSGKRILVAEDNALNLEIVEELLKMSGAVVECAANGQEAVMCFARSVPGYFDAILMDVQMPIMDGYEATRQIRAMERPDAATIPIIATTANAFSEDISTALAAGMNAHVSKPIDIQQLCAVLSQYT